MIGHYRTVILPVIALLLLGCQSRPVSNDMPENTANLVDRFENRLALKLFDDAFDDAVALSPETQTHYGIHDNNDKWTPYSYRHSLERVELMEAHWEKIQESIDVERLNRQNRLSYELYGHNTKRARQNLEFWWHYYPVNQMWGRHTGMPAFLINIHPGRNISDLEDYVQRLKGMETELDRLIAVMKEQESRGIRQPKFVYTHALDDCRNLITGKPFDESTASSPLLDDFVTKVRHLDLIESESARLIDRARSALIDHVGPGYQRLIEYLQSARERARVNAGAWHLPEGAAFYAARLQTFTTTALTADDIHELGTSEVRRIQDEIRTVMKETDFDGSLQEFFEFTRTDDQFFFENSEAGKQAYLDLSLGYIVDMQAALPKMTGTLPEADLIVKAVEPWREKSAGKAFYSSPSPTGDRPGIVYLNLHDLRDMPVWELESLIYHEGIPGHHLQNSIALQLEDIPKFRRFGGVTAYGEGWGLYAEYFPLEFGFYENSWSDFGRLTAELWRAARLVVDTGLHHKKWSREEAIEYLVENTPAPRDQAVKSVERYLVIPGQATAYKIGMLKILELRSDAEARLGDDFDLAEFHDVILGNGPLPLSFVERMANEWLEGKNK